MSFLSSTRAALILGASLIVAAAIGARAIGTFNQAGDDIQVTGSATRQVEADFAVWRLEVRTTLPTQTEASRATRQHTTDVRAFLLEQGFPDSAITVRAPYTFIEHEYINGYQTGRIRGYQVSQEIEVRTTLVDQVAALSGDPEALITRSRGNVMPSQPEYLINALPAIRGTLTADATRDAEQRAREILAAVNATPGRLKAVRVGVIQVSRRNAIEVSDYGMYDTSDRLKEVRAVVRVTFAVSR